MIWMRQMRLAAGILLAMTGAALAIELDTPLSTAERFGFSGREVFRVDSQISQLRAGDLDGDGLNDLVVVNNLRSKINLMYNQTGKTNLNLPVSLKREINELSPGARFRIESIASEKRIAALVLADLNGDSKPDVAYFGEPRELVVLYNEGNNSWSQPKRWIIEDGQLSANGLCTGDLNGDSRDDLVLLGESSIYIFHQEPDHSLAEPRKLPFSGSVRSVQVVDANGDRRGDLLLVNWEDTTPFRLRLQRVGGDLGPELFFPSAPIRSFWADKLAPEGPTQVITIAQNSGRAQVAEFVQKPAEPLAKNFVEGQFQVMPLARTIKAQRGLVWADVNRDGRADLLVAEPENGQLAIYLQNKDGELAAPRSFPSLAGVTELSVADWDADGHPEIFLLSADERQVGVARFDDNRGMPFPELIPLQGRPLVMTAGKLTADGPPVLAVLVDVDGKRSLVTVSSDARTRRQSLGEKFMSAPGHMAIHDADQDGHSDLVVLIPYEKTKVLRQVPGCDYEEIDLSPPGGLIEQPWLSAVDVDGDGKNELLLPQKNFVRAVMLSAGPAMTPSGTSSNQVEWSFRVKQQINGMASNSRLAGAVAVASEIGAAPHLFLLDPERKVLSICERDDSSVWRIIRNVLLPRTEFNGLGAVALGAAQLKSVVFSGLNQVGWLPLDGKVWSLAELDAYETLVRDGHLTDVITGDLDNDGRKDLVFLETARNYLDLVIFDSRQKLIPANRWQVFEERTFRPRRGDLPEPREAVIADLTGNGKNDLAVLVHDRVILYPQE